jgi:hypothetical protein
MLVSGFSGVASMLGATALSRLDKVMAPKEPEAASGPLSAAPAKTAKDEFLEYQQMTPAQKMRAAMLSKLEIGRAHV